MTRRRFTFTIAAFVAALLPVLLVPSGRAAAGAGGGGSFQVVFDPPLSRLHAQGNPDSERSLTAVTVEARGPEGRLLAGAVIDVTLTAPRFNPLARSDVPRVEGRRLLHTRFAAVDGRQTFKYVWPIRGQYRLDLRAAPAPGSGARFVPFDASQSFRIGERAGEERNLLIFLVALFGLGAASALVLLRSHRLSRLSADALPRRGSPPARPGRAGPWRLRLSVPGVVGAGLGLWVVGLLAFLVFQQVKDTRSDHRVATYQGPAQGETKVARSDAVALSYELGRSSGDGIGVQTLLRTSGRVEDARTGQPVPGVGIRLEAVDLEGGDVVFATDAIAPDGRFTWDHDFWDGVDYDLRVTAVPGSSGLTFPPVSTGAHVAVQPMSPPIGAKFLGLGYLLLALLAGMATTLLVSRRWQGSVRPAVGAGRLDPQAL
jgi:hypothetical protein